MAVSETHGTAIEEPGVGRVYGSGGGSGREVPLLKEYAAYRCMVKGH